MDTTNTRNEIAYPASTQILDSAAPDAALIAEFASISATHQRATALMGDGIAECDANAREIRELGGAIDAGVERVIATHAVTLAGMAAKAELLLLIGLDDDLSTSIAHDLIRNHRGAEVPAD